MDSILYSIYVKSVELYHKEPLQFHNMRKQTTKRLTFVFTGSELGLIT